jgi:hypothetical protein
MCDTYKYREPQMKEFYALFSTDAQSPIQSSVAIFSKPFIIRQKCVGIGSILEEFFSEGHSGN